MDESDYAELLSHIRRRIREAGSVDLDDALAAAASGGNRSPSAIVVAYLEQLRTVARLRSGLAVSDALLWLREHVATHNGEPVTGIHLDTADANGTYGDGTVDLTAASAPPQDPADAALGIEEIDHLLQLVRSDDAIGGLR
jgi:hypothetical protein